MSDHIPSDRDEFGDEIETRRPAGDGLREQAVAAAAALRAACAAIVTQHEALGLNASAEAAGDILGHLEAIDDCIADID